MGGVESAFKPIDPAPAMTPAASKEAAKSSADNMPYDASQVPLFRTTLLDTKLSLFERYRAMFALRNVAHGGGDGAVEAVLALAQGLQDGSALFRHEICFVFGELCTPLRYLACSRCSTTIRSTRLLGTKLQRHWEALSRKRGRARRGKDRRLQAGVGYAQEVGRGYGSTEGGQGELCGRAGRAGVQQRSHPVPPCRKLPPWPLPRQSGH